jgi:hypothetical protein
LFAATARAYNDCTVSSSELTAKAVRAVRPMRPAASIIARA